MLNIVNKNHLGFKVQKQNRFLAGVYKGRKQKSLNFFKLRLLLRNGRDSNPRPHA